MLEQVVSTQPMGYWQFWKRHRPSTQNCDLLDSAAFTTYYKSVETKPVGKSFDNQFMDDNKDFISQYREGSALNTYNVLDDILIAPIKLEEYWHHWSVWK